MFFLWGAGIFLPLILFLFPFFPFSAPLRQGLPSVQRTEHFPSLSLTLSLLLWEAVSDVTERASKEERERERKERAIEIEQEN